MAVRIATVIGSLPARISAAAAVSTGSRVRTRIPLGFCVSATSDDHSCAVTRPSVQHSCHGAPRLGLLRSRR
eukprot:3975698-Prymnesium_polylepis.1